MADANGKELEQWGIVKSQIPSTKSQGVRFQVSVRRNRKAET
jgi:hypothetical protein